MRQWIVAENHVASFRMTAKIFMFGIGIRLDRFVMMDLITLIGQRTSTEDNGAKRNAEKAIVPCIVRKMIVALNGLTANVADEQTA